MRKGELKQFEEGLKLPTIAGLAKVEDRKLLCRECLSELDLTVAQSEESNAPNSARCKNCGWSESKSEELPYVPVVLPLTTLSIEDLLITLQDDSRFADPAYDPARDALKEALNKTDYLGGMRW
jgi:hypothetical protein